MPAKFIRSYSEYHLREIQTYHVCCSPARQEQTQQLTLIEHFLLPISFLAQVFQLLFPV
jgi:hypothetical protein